MIRIWIGRALYWFLKAHMHDQQRRAALKGGNYGMAVGLPPEFRASPAEQLKRQRIDAEYQKKQAAPGNWQGGY